MKARSQSQSREIGDENGVAANGVGQWCWRNTATSLAESTDLLLVCGHFPSQQMSNKQYASLEFKLI